VVAALGGDVGLDTVLGETVREVLDSLAGRALALNEDAVRAGGLEESELVESDAAATSLGDAGTGSLRELESADVHLGAEGETVVVGDGADNDSNLTVLAVHHGSHAGEGKRGAVGLRHAKTLEDDLVEVRVGATGHEAVQLGEKTDLVVVRLGSSAAPVTNAATSLEINTLNRSAGEK
jgi:hypothetical protein